jgi:hypothetical protein
LGAERDSEQDEFHRRIIGEIEPVCAEKLRKLIGRFYEDPVWRV